MGSWEAVISVVLGVIMRKSICRFQEMGKMAMEFISVLSTALRFSGLLFRRPVPVPTTYSPMSSVATRGFTALTVQYPLHQQRSLQEAIRCCGSKFKSVDLSLKEKT
ncbi:uncharacterized protein LOC103721513 [Phoenix dactylifera]|uniref:Uncharacterized protein LOC103721513 n=1 Tax=Phoenix dactylifera TaxID=42345 RepID=A0A8B7CZF6_PHODC|nr:uncharacterized protein LOC103721513 [Phoenix dactylifera]